MRGLSLYSGLGGMDLAAASAGIEIVAHCEPDEYCRQRLAIQYPGSKVYELDSDISAERLKDDGLWPIDILLGGPPCQSVSLAGKRLGPADPRFRWPEALRILGELLPAWVVWENPPGLASAAAGAVLDSIQDTMAEMGYTVGRGQWGAADLGAPHRRERVFLVGRLAYAVRSGGQQESRGAHGDEAADEGRRTADLYVHASAGEGIG